MKTKYKRQIVIKSRTDGDSGLGACREGNCVHNKSIAGSQSNHNFIKANQSKTRVTLFLRS